MQGRQMENRPFLLSQLWGKTAESWGIAATAE